MTDERRTDGPGYAEFTERRNMAKRLKDILKPFKWVDTATEGIAETADFPILPPSEFDELYGALNWTLRMEAEDVGLRPIHAIRRVISTGASNDGLRVSTVIYGFDTREYIREVVDREAEDPKPQVVDMTDIWRYSRTIQRDKAGRVTWQTEAGVMVPVVTEGGLRVVLTPGQLGGIEAYANERDMMGLSVLLDQAEVYGRLHREDEPEEEAPAVDVGRAGMRLVYTDNSKPRRV